MNWAALLRALPEIINFVKLVIRQQEAAQGSKPDSKQVKEKIKEINQALEEGDEKKLNAAFNSL
jgi:hypothetical protein